MSSQIENIKIVKNLYSSFSDKNISAILEMLSPDVEWGEPSNPFNPAGGTRYGHEGFLEWINIGRQTEDILELQPKKMLTDIDSVAVIGFIKCRAISTGKIYESDFVHFITIKDGLVVKFQEFFDTYIAGEAFRQK
jgi:ketosteroid isomerase-like protein